MFIRSGGTEVDATHGTGAGDVEEPGVDAFGMEFVVARKDADVLAFCEVVCADRAGQAVIGVCNGVVGKVWFGGFGCFWFSRDGTVVSSDVLV